ncbi:MAG: sigma 54-interacting transcriptional regulator [Deltaproteobacteria bacterium]|nr:sigma 54-interacting transcriptional regulator [Deltaproteobacteria bacterium]
MSQALDSCHFPLVLDVLDQGVFTVDENLSITSFNRAAEQISGYRAEEVIGRKCSELFRTALCNQVCPLRLSIQSRGAIRNRQIHIHARDGRQVPITLSTVPLLTRTGKLLGGVEVFKDISQIIDLKRRLDYRHRLIDIVGKSRVMKQIFELLPLVANSDSTVLITGASGTGKELIARTIHTLGQRRKGPFIPINCAAIPETLLEAELFGHIKGAFTDAHRDRSGRIATAEGGSLFLDEIGDLPRAVQVKVLRFLQDREFTPLGSNRSVRANVRVITATNRDLLALVREGVFREDLYFRLNVVQIDIPPLSERTEDIPLLANHYVKVFRETTAKSIEGLTEQAMALLISYPFPGNVRELENILERAFILCQSDRIGPEHLPQNVVGSSSLSGRNDMSKTSDAGLIRAALQRNGGNRTRAAAEMGIHRITLLRRMRRLGLS